MKFNCIACDKTFTFKKMPEDKTLICDLCGGKLKRHKKDGVSRFDVMEQSKEWLTTALKRDTNGFLTGQAIVTNVGVFTYRDSEGNILRELRPPEEVFKFDSLKSMEMLPLTNNHPPEKLTPENTNKYQVGQVGDWIRQDAYVVSAPVKITDEKTIIDIELREKVALSCGYSVDLEFTPGNWLGIQYDAIQRNIRYNHIAIVDKGRAGDLAKLVLRKDSADAISEGIELSKGNEKKDKKEQNLKVGEKKRMELVKVTLNDISYDSAPEVANALKKADSDLVVAKKDFSAKEKELNDSIEKLSAEKDTLQDKIDTLTKELEENKITPEKIDTAISTRLGIIKIAEAVKVEVNDKMSDLDIKKAVIAKVFPKADLKEKSDAYVEARYDGAVEAVSEEIAKAKETEDKNDSANTNRNKVFSDHNKDGEEAKPLSADEKRDSHIEEITNAWKQDKNSDKGAK